jgi:hypothetical protein
MEMAVRSRGDSIVDIQGGSRLIRYHPGVLVEFNEKAWCNGTLFLQWVQQELLEIMKPTAI